MFYIASYFKVLAEMLENNSFTLLKGSVGLAASVLIGYTQFYIPNLKNEFDQLKLEYEVEAKIEKSNNYKPFGKIDCFKIPDKEIEVKCRLAKEMKYQNSDSEILFDTYKKNVVFLSYTLLVLSFMGFMGQLSSKAKKQRDSKKENIENEVSD